MRIFKKISDLRSFIQEAKSQGKTIGFVPTMGALHAGHLHLVTQAKQKADIVVASIFVNPTQFGKNEDLSKYPRKETEDIAKLTETGCDAVFLPKIEEIYPSGSGHEPSNKIAPSDIEKYYNILCGAFRPGHFAGVVQVVSRLFNIVTPDIAVFGEKDFQQLFIIKKLAEDIKNIQTIGVPTIRDEYGLALSSRNVYLSDDELAIARKLNVFIKKKLQNLKSAGISSISNNDKTELLSLGFTRVDYIEFRNSLTLEIEKQYTPQTRIFAAAYIGKTRLIDNLGVKELLQ
ncbi:MAG TPA: pantoate--beta-alanine ligase [Alphaproteobacteria bacterium]|nr:pantoate--beta-alanine ligase [Alphaproteobacteria bacterium]